MATHSGQRGPGTTTIEASARDWLKYENIDQFNDAYIAEIATGMLRRWQVMKGATEAEIKGAADAKETGYRENFVQFWKARGMTGIDQTSADVAWRKVRAKASQLYYQQRMQSSAPPLPEQKPPVTPAEEELIEITEGIEIVPDELPDSLKPEHWTEWRAMPLNNDTIGKLNFGFGHALAKELPRLSDEQVQEVRHLYEGIVSDMYATTYPGIENPREQISRALESYWRALLESTRLIAPVEQPSK